MSSSGSGSPLSSRSSSPSPRPNLTFGLELEFSLAVLPVSFRDIHPHHTRSVYTPIRDPKLPVDAPASSDAWNDDHLTHGIHGNFLKHEVKWTKNAKAHIASFLESHGFRSTVTGSFNCRLANDISVKEKFDQEVWTVAEDNSITRGYNHGYFLLGIEIKTPPLLFNESSLQKVRNVLNLLSKKYMILCDESSSIHVHIGKSGKSFSLDTVKNFTMLAYTLEEQLSLLHPKRYSTGPFVLGWSLPYSPLIRQYSKLSRQAKNLLTKRGGSALNHALDLIYSKTNINSIVDLTYTEDDSNYPRIPGCRLTYNLSNLIGSEEINAYDDGDDHPDKESKENKFQTTVEFRQHRSHLDGEEVTNWITVCAGLVEYAEEFPFPDLLLNQCKELVVRDVDEQSLFDVLCLIGCRTQAEWYQDMLKRVQEDREAFEKAVSYGPIDHRDHFPSPLGALGRG
ncbi:amidoligase enzyme protein [Rutstroemia sp. NJR-2017a BBW]|nr:amidoligase enzyme protein [Rutstroemia sp. NJR-2017a BBW]